MGVICRSRCPGCVPSRAFVRPPLRMQSRHPTAPRGSHLPSSSCSKSVSLRRAQRWTNVVTASQIRRRSAAMDLSADLVVTHVANCEPPPSLSNDPQKEEEQDTLPTPIGTPEDPEQDPETLSEEPVVKRRENAVMLQCVMAVVVLSAAMGCVLPLFGMLDGAEVSMLGRLCVLPFVWNWLNRIQTCWDERRKWKSVVGMGIRVVLTWLFLCATPFQFKSFIFEGDRAMLAVCGAFTAASVAGHLLLRPWKKPVRPPAELETPIAALLLSMFISDTKTFKRMENRLPMAWLFVTSIVVVPVLYEILLRGVFVFSFSMFYPFLGAALQGALVHCLMLPFRSIRHLLATLWPSFVWGSLFLVADLNLMYPIVAHMIHNAILFGIYHYEALAECLQP